MYFCDMNCIHARWPDRDALDGSASCRTFQAIFCEKKGRPGHKNAPCRIKEKRGKEENGRE